MSLRRGLLIFVLLVLSALQGLGSASANNSGPGIFPNTNQNPVLGPVAKRNWTDLVYATVSEAEKLDIYLPNAVSVTPYPVIIYIHGGGFSHGDKISPENSGLVAQMLADGYAVASINYRLSGEATFPAAVQDAKAAVRWLRANAASYNLDTSHFGAWGDSAGGNLVAILGTSCGVGAPLEGSFLGNAGESSCVQAVVDWFGPTDFLQMDDESAIDGCTAHHDSLSSPEGGYLGAVPSSVPVRANAANPITYVTLDDPPFYIEHGTADCNVPYQQSQLLYDALQPVLGSSKVTLTLLPGAVHEDPQYFTTSNVDIMLSFLDTYLK